MWINPNSVLKNVTNVAVALSVEHSPSIAHSRTSGKSYLLHRNSLDGGGM